MLYGFCSKCRGGGDGGLLEVPNSLGKLLRRMHLAGYDVDYFSMNVDASGQSLVAVLAILGENPCIAAGVDRMQLAIEQRMKYACNGNKTVTETLAGPGK